MSEQSARQSSEADRQKRTQEIEKALKVFSDRSYKKYGINLVLARNASDEIAAYYFSILETHIRGLIPDRANRYKMASLTQLAIVKVQPFTLYDEYHTRNVNAEFALTCAFSIIWDMELTVTTAPSARAIQSLVPGADLRRMLSQHKEWLRNKNPDHFPAFLNAMHLELLWLCMRNRESQVQ